MLEREGIRLEQEMSEVRLPALSANNDSRERLREVSRSDTLIEPAARKFQVKLLA